MDKIEIGVSKCLLGEPVRYDGQHKHDHFITDTLGRYFEFVGVCGRDVWTEERSANTTRRR